MPSSDVDNGADSSGKDKSLLDQRLFFFFPYVLLFATMTLDESKIREGTGPDGLRKCLLKASSLRSRGPLSFPIKPSLCYHCLRRIRFLKADYFFRKGRTLRDVSE